MPSRDFICEEMKPDGDRVEIPIPLSSQRKIMGAGIFWKDATEEAFMAPWRVE
jgi:lysophospholipid acyltransferase (LPLAT)-like uncharacterized protein